MDRLSVTNTEIAEFIEEIADHDTIRRVLLAALTDPQTRARLEMLRQLDSSAASADSSVPQVSLEERLASLQMSLMNSAHALIQAANPPQATGVVSSLGVQANLVLNEAQRGGIIRRVAGEALQGILEEWDKAIEGMRSLFVGRREHLTLPCLAPGTAASAADLQIHRQSVVSADGVRIEFQQLPTPALNRLRVFVDASTLTAETQQPLQTYNVAFLTLEEERGGRNTAGVENQQPPPDRHILVIALNAEGRGFVDLTIGSASTAEGSSGKAANPDGAALTEFLPAPRSAYALISATLSRRGD